MSQIGMMVPCVQVCGLTSRAAHCSAGGQLVTVRSSALCMATTSASVQHLFGPVP